MITELVSLLSTCIAPNIGTYGQFLIDTTDDYNYSNVSNVSCNVNVNSIKLLVNSFTCDLTFTFNMSSFICQDNTLLSSYTNFNKQFNYIANIPYDGSLLSYCNSNDYLRFLSSVDIALKISKFNFPNYDIGSGPAVSLTALSSISLIFDNPNKPNTFTTSSDFNRISNDDFITLAFDSSYAPSDSQATEFLNKYSKFIAGNPYFSPTNGLIFFNSNTYHSNIDISSYNKLLVTAIYEDTSKAYNEGYNVGYNDGIEKGISGSNPFTLVFSGINDILSIEIFPNFKLMYVVGFGLFVGLLMFILGFFK